MTSAKRITAVAIKEWRLNTRFLTAYIAANLVGPIKTAILMIFIYGGFLSRADTTIGMVNRDNFQTFVLLGTTCHGVMLASLYIFRTKMVMEKWWQTVTATLVSPVKTIEMIFGFILGSGAFNLLIGTTLFGLIAIFLKVSLSAFLLSLLTLLLLSLFAFGLGLLGATVALCWEGKSYLFDYSIQALAFLSCFYYPIETLPSFFHSFIRVLPTFQAAQLIQELYLFGSSGNILSTLTYLTLLSVVTLSIPAFFFEYSLKRYGIVGY